MMELNVTVTANDGRRVIVTAAQASAIEAMTNTRKGGCASVEGYIPTSNWDVSPVHNIQMITHFSTKKLYQRRLKALQAIQFSDVAENAAKQPKLAALTAAKLLETFETRKAKMVATLENSLDDSAPKNAYQEAHVRCYAYIGDVKVHLRTEMVDGRKEPEPTSDGRVVAESIMVPYLELNTTVVKEGVRHVTNSGAAVLMSKLIEKCLNKRSVIYKTLSLKEDNFTAFKTDRKVFLPEDVVRFGEVLED